MDADSSIDGSGAYFQWVRDCCFRKLAIDASRRRILVDQTYYEFELFLI